ncbi:arginine--tRNA ligase [Psychrobacillus sp. Sa2BUA9]|uniref:Arginine--tRNA ligase n=1 Tax=Psychrobacillus faecigallinarum TaxID=2762235 RepID=A0ABR8RC09_9BACI|nr:arginine--tRNA ligase [Psychrobacillus faecigallinarum]MBD7945333.1 arginine--tRNA ligase [Psychrobacillus faecigallinarum]
MELLKQIAISIETELESKLTVKEIQMLLEKPKNIELGDLAFPCFTLAKLYKKSPQLIASELAKQVKSSLIANVEAVGGYLNIFYDQKTIAKEVLGEILKNQNNYGQLPMKDEQVTIDLSSPNIAKPFSMGHLRSTVIGNALANISEKNGYKAVRINHLGDWGTQFGKLIVAYKLWGDKEKIEASPIEELLKIYVKFHEKAEVDEELNVEARAAFKSLEQGNEEALQLWKWFKEASLKEFQYIYELLGIQFDSFNGEAFYNDKMETVVKEIEEKGLLVESDGALVVELENMPPCLIKKTDGATLYATRDLAAALYRQNNYAFTKAFYVVGNEQSLHFKQLFSVLQKMGYAWAKDCQHVPFGMMLKDGKKMSTRKGKVILLKEVLNEAIEEAKKSIEEKNPSLLHKEEVAKSVGVGAVIFHDLKNHRMNDVEFSLEQMLNFEGETGPYVQYTHARINSLLQKGKFETNNMSFAGLGEPAWPTIMTLQGFPQVIQKSFEHADPSLIAKYCLTLSRHFNKYYANTKILVGDETKRSKLTLCYAVAIVLKEGLSLLGIDAPEQM